MVLCLFFDYLFYDKALGINFPLYVGLILARLFFLIYYTQRSLPRQVVWPTVPLAFFSLMVFFRAGELLTFLNIVASLLLLLLSVEIVFGKNLKDYFLNTYLAVFVLPFKFLKPFFQTVLDVFTSRRIIRNPKVASQVIKGVALTVPALIVFLLLFSSADLIFQKHLSGLLDIGLNAETVFRSILVLAVASLFVGAYSYIFRSSAETSSQHQHPRAYTIGRIEASILLGSIGALFAVFIIIQLAYLFGGESALVSQGFTYAEYARRGFFELIVVALISFCLLWVVEKYIVKDQGEHILLFKLLSGTLIVEVIFIMVSAFMRLSLYESAYGFTALRLYSNVFIIWLAVIFLFLLYKIFRNEHENSFTFRVFISIVGFLLFMNILNPDAFIAQRNIELFVPQNKLDFVHLSQLSDDAVPVIAKLLDSPEGYLREFAAQDIRLRSERAADSYFSSWQSVNVGRLRATSILNSELKVLNNNL